MFQQSAKIDVMHSLGGRSLTVQPHNRFIGQKGPHQPFKMGVAKRSDRVGQFLPHLGAVTR